MYKVLKDRGRMANVIVLNTETNSEIKVGRLSYDIVTLLNDAGYKVGADEEITLIDKWDFTVNHETAQELAKKAMRMSKPIRKHATPETPKETAEEKPKDLFQKPNKDIDAMDVLLGLANYN